MFPVSYRCLAILGGYWTFLSPCVKMLSSPPRGEKERELMNKKVSNAYAGFAQRLGLQMDPSGGLYGQRGGYAWTIFAPDPRYPYQLLVTTPAHRPAGALNKEDVRQFRREHKEVFIFNQRQNDVSITVRVKGAKGGERLESAMNALTELLRTQSFRPCCQNCGQELPVEGYFVSGSYMQVCDSCAQALKQSHNTAQTQRTQKSENVVGGIVGSLIGSLLGVLCIVLLSQLGVVAALSGLIMAVCTLKGYEMLGGKLSNRGIVISIVVMIVMTFVGDRIDWAILVSQQLEMPLPMAFQAVPVLLAEEIIVPSAYWTNLVLLYVFMLGGAVPTIRSSIRNRRFVNLVYRLGHPPVEL